MAEIGGSTYISTYTYLRVYAAEIEVDRVNNRSKVQYGLNMHVTAGHYAASGIDVWMRGVENALGYQSYSTGTYTLMDRTEWINHNADGSGSINVYWSFSSAITSWLEGSASLTLTKINRYPVLNSGSNFTDRTNPVYNITAYGTYPIRVKLEAGGNSQLITRDLSSKNSQTYTLQLTDAERKLLRSKSSDGKTLAVIETVCAMSGNTELSSSYKSYTMTIVRKPVKIRKDGAWVNAFPYVRVNGQWKEAKPYIRVNGSWKEEK